MEGKTLHGDGGCVCRVGEDEDERKNGSGARHTGEGPELWSKVKSERIFC